MFVESVKALIPELPVEIEPSAGALQANAFQAADAMFATPLLNYQGSGLEYTQMSRNRRLGNSKWPRKFSDGSLAESESRQNSPSGWVRECGECLVKIYHIAILLYNLLVKSRCADTGRSFRVVFRARFGHGRQLVPQQ